MLAIAVVVGEGVEEGIGVEVAEGVGWDAGVGNGVGNGVGEGVGAGALIFYFGKIKLTTEKAKDKLKKNQKITLANC